MSAIPVIPIVAAVILDAECCVLLVRKRGSAIFIQPGGKREAGEASLDTLQRELREELGVAISLSKVERLGEFEAEAVHEPGHRVIAEVYLVVIEGTVVAGAEIEELCWVCLDKPAHVSVAPLSERQIFPAVLRHLAAIRRPP